MQIPQDTDHVSLFTLAKLNTTQDLILKICSVTINYLLINNDNSISIKMASPLSQSYPIKHIV